MIGRARFGGRRSALVLGALLIASLLTTSAEGYPRPARTTKIAVTKDGVHGNFGSGNPQISGNGRYVAFNSGSNNLGPEKTGFQEDVYVLDRDTGEFEIVSRASDGSAGKGFSHVPSISYDGRFVAFQSKAWNFTPGYQGSILSPLQVYVHDRETGETVLVSRPHDGEGYVGNAHSLRARISGDGRYVAFESDATNLVPGDDNGSRDVFVFDRVSQEVELASVATGGRQSTSHSYDPSLNFDGRYVGFTSGLENEDQTRDFQAFVRDRQTGETEMVSINNRGERGSRGALNTRISSDGRYVAFMSASTNLVPNDNNDNFNNSQFPNFDIFVRDRLEGRTERVSVNSSGTEGNAWSQDPHMSNDGRFIVFDSRSSNLSPQHTDGEFQIYLHDRMTGITEHISVDDNGERPPFIRAMSPDVSDDGRLVAFVTEAAFDPGDDNLANDVYIRDRGPALGVARLQHEQDARAVSFFGDATFSGVVLLDGDDPADDGAAAAEELGAELTGADVRYRMEDESIRLRWRITDLNEIRPGLWDEKQPETFGQPGVMYGARITVAGNAYEVRAARYATAGGDPLPQPFFGLFRCLGGCDLVARLEGGIGSTGQDVVTSVPLEDIGFEGNDLTGINFYTARGDALIGPAEVLDEVALSDSRIPVALVESGIAPEEVSDDDVSFSPAELSTGRFIGTIDTSALEGGRYNAWVRACFGPDCSTYSWPVQLGAADPDPTGSPTSTPTDDPSPEDTEIAFTARSATAGQYSDETFFEGRLMDGDGDPIDGAELTFELAGADSARTFTDITDDDGVASVTPTLDEKPGTYQLTVRYAGDDAHDPSADTTTFVIDKEDTDLELTVAGKGKNRTLTVRLSDRDTASEGITNRTIDFYADGESIGSATTNSNGVATLQAPPRYRGGKHDFEARFEGDDSYLNSSDRRQT